MLIPQQGPPKGSTTIGSTFDTKKTEGEGLISQRLRGCISESKTTVSFVGETPDFASITTPSEWGSTVNMHDESSKMFNGHCEQPKSFAGCRNNNLVASSIVESEPVPLFEGPKKVHFSTGTDARFQGNGCCLISPPLPQV